MQTGPNPFTIWKQLKGQTEAWAGPHRGTSWVSLLREATLTSASHVASCPLESPCHPRSQLERAHGPSPAAAQVLKDQAEKTVAQLAGR